MQMARETNKARYLRQESTPEEKILWKFLRTKQFGVKFRRQHPIEMFVIDFYAPSIKLAIELDGKNHATKIGKEYDEMRTKFLESKDIKIMRFWNSEIKNNLNEVIKKIENEIKI